MELNNGIANMLLHYVRIRKKYPDPQKDFFLNNHSFLTYYSFTIPKTSYFFVVYSDGWEVNLKININDAWAVRND